MKKTSVIILICFVMTFIGGCSMFSKDYKLKEVITENSSGLTELYINNRVGKIEIKPASDETLKIEAVKAVRSNDKNLDKELMENIKIFLSMEGNKAVLNTVTKNDQAVDFWTWKDANYPNINISVDYVIRVPKNIKLYSVTNGIGGINADKIGGVLNLNSEMGKIVLSNITLEGDSTFVSDLGDLKMDVTGINNTKNINIMTNLGSMDIKLPKSFDYNISKESAQTTTKAYTLSNKDTSISISAGLGTIRLNGSKLD